MSERDTDKEMKDHFSEERKEIEKHHVTVRCAPSGVSSTSRQTYQSNPGRKKLMTFTNAVLPLRCVKVADCYSGGSASGGHTQIVLDHVVSSH